MLKAICKNDFKTVEKCVKEDGFDINGIIDKQQKYNAMTLACHLDNLEMVHFLDILGASLNESKGINGTTPLMAATNRWNVRIVDYLIERGADPYVKDAYGFTVTEKAKIKNLKTIHSMLTGYETTYRFTRTGSVQSPLYINSKMK